MKLFIPILFIAMAAVFLLISTVFYPAVYHYFIELGQKQGNVPSFWDLEKVLGFVRIIFIIVGIFLTAFGIGLLITKNFLFR